MFRTREENPWSSAPIAAVRELLPPEPPPAAEGTGQFSWADPARVRRILEGAGFGDVLLTPHDPLMRLGSGAAEAADLVLHFGPVVRATQNAPTAKREALGAALENFFQAHDGPQGVVMPGAIWIVSARA